MEAVFVGRAAELEAIAEVLSNAARDRHSTAIAIIGEPGSGKSRLLQEARARLPTGQAISIVGYEPETGVPLSAAVDLVASLASAPGGSDLEELLARRPGEPAGDPLEPLRLLEAAHRAMESLGDVWILMDDLQWVDAATRSLIHYVIRAATSRPLGLVVATRQSEFSSGPAQLAQPAAR